MGIESAYNEILKKLEHFNRKEFKVLAALGIQIAFLLTVSSFFVFTLIEAASNSNSIVRTIFFILFLVISIISLIVFAVIPLLKYLKILGKTDYDIVCLLYTSPSPRD